MSLARSSRLRIPALAAVSSILGGALGVVLGTCGPFTDVAADSFCPFVLEIFYLGITTGTTPTTYDPSGNVSRLQMAAFLSRTVDRTLQRGSRRAALNQYWKTRANLDTTTLGKTVVSQAFTVVSDGADLWVPRPGDTAVERVRASDGKSLGTWTGADNAFVPLAAMGQVFVTGSSNPGRLYWIDPSLPAGAVTTVASNLGNGPYGITFDGSRIWTTNIFGTVSIVTPGASIPWTVTNVGGFANPLGILYDGASVWVTQNIPDTLVKLGADGSILQTVTVGGDPEFPAFDGANIWVPNSAPSTISVVRASNGSILATLTGNGLLSPYWAAFDGERVLVTNIGGNSVSLWKAADLTAIGTFPTGAGTSPTGACSDGVNFWIALSTANRLARF